MGLRKVWFEAHLTLVIRQRTKESGVHIKTPTYAKNCAAPHPVMLTAGFKVHGIDDQKRE